MQNIDFQGVIFIPDLPLLPISIESLESVEAQLGFTFPDDYRAFITTLGTGETEFGFGAWSPKDILKVGIGEMRSRLSEFWFWDKSPDILTQSQAIECVPFFVSGDGDDILFHPSDRKHWFILGHEEEMVIVVHSFQELCNFYHQRYEDLQAPYRFQVWPELGK